MVSVSVDRVASKARLRLRPSQWRLSVALMLLMLAASTSLSGLIAEGTWWVALNGTVLLILSVATLVRLLGMPRFVVPMINITVLLMLITGVFGGGTGLLGVIPTSATLSHVRDTIVTIVPAIMQQAPPADPLPQFMFAVASAGGACAVMLDFLAITVGIPAASGVVVLGIFIFPAVLLGSGVSPLALMVCAIAYIFVLHTANRIRFRGWGEARLSMVLGAVTLVVALVVAVTAPGFAQIGRQGVIASGLTVGNGVSPLIDLGDDLRRPESVPVMEYTTTAKKPKYLRMTSLDTFTGTVWRHRSGQVTEITESGRINSARDPNNEGVSARVTTTMKIESMESAWLPVPYRAVEVRGLSGRWLWDARDFTLSATNTSTRNQSYTVTSLVPNISAETLQHTGEGSDGRSTMYASRDLFVPIEVPAIITDTAERVTAGAQTEYEKALDLQDYFQDSGFQYSTSAPIHDAYDGDSMQSVAAFLAVKSGYCVHFASAMAIMARVLGIPSRIGIGYLPGVASSERDGKTLYRVSSDDLHAWPELYFSGVGWVSFEPTVGRGNLPGYTVAASEENEDVALATSLPKQTQSTNIPNENSTGLGTNASHLHSARGVMATTITILLLIVFALVLPASVRAWQSRAHLRRLDQDAGNVGLAWTELRNITRDLRIPLSETQTPRAMTAVITRELENNPDAIRALNVILRSRERDEYQRPECGAVGLDLAKNLRAVRTALFASATVRSRFRAYFVPISLLYARGPRIRERATFSA